MKPILAELPAHLREQFDNKLGRLICSSGEWQVWGEFLLSRRNIRLVMLTDWPDIDLPGARTRWEAEMAITRAYGGNRVRFKVLRSADD